ncbi:hypothetical protein [Streptomyces sp. SS8]
MSDHFDRLLTRHAPAALSAGPAAGGGPDTPVRVRPRLPEPYERVEALRADHRGQDEADPFLRPALRPAVLPGEERTAVRHEREIRTEHHTVVRTEPAPHGDRTRPPVAARPARSPRTTAPTTAPPRPGTEPTPRRGGHTVPARADRDAPSAAAPAPAFRNAGPASPPNAAVPLRPSAAGASAARDAARAAAGRRRPRTAERTVHVRIGRLEVSAAPPATGPTGTDRPQRPARPVPALSLADYLAGSERRD